MIGDSPRHDEATLEVRGNGGEVYYRGDRGHDFDSQYGIDQLAKTCFDKRLRMYYDPEDGSVLCYFRGSVGHGKQMYALYNGESDPNSGGESEDTLREFKQAVRYGSSQSEFDINDEGAGAHAVFRHLDDEPLPRDELPVERIEEVLDADDGPDTVAVGAGSYKSAAQLATSLAAHDQFSVAVGLEQWTSDQLSPDVVVVLQDDRDGQLVGDAREWYQDSERERRRKSLREDLSTAEDDADPEAVVDGLNARVFEETDYRLYDPSWSDKHTSGLWSRSRMALQLISVVVTVFVMLPSQWPTVQGFPNQSFDLPLRGTIRGWWMLGFDGLLGVVYFGTRYWRYLSNLIQSGLDTSSGEKSEAGSGQGDERADGSEESTGSDDSAESDDSTAANEAINGAVGTFKEVKEQSELDDDFLEDVFEPSTLDFKRRLPIGGKRCERIRDAVGAAGLGSVVGAIRSFLVGVSPGLLVGGLLYWALYYSPTPLADLYHVLLGITLIATLFVSWVPLRKTIPLVREPLQAADWRTVTSTLGKYYFPFVLSMPLLVDAGFREWGDRGVVHLVAYVLAPVFSVSRGMLLSGALGLFVLVPIVAFTVDTVRDRAWKSIGPAVGVVVTALLGAYVVPGLFAQWRWVLLVGLPGLYVGVYTLWYIISDFDRSTLVSRKWKWNVLVASLVGAGAVVTLDRHVSPNLPGVLVIFVVIVAVALQLHAVEVPDSFDGVTRRPSQLVAGTVILWLVVSVIVQLLVQFGPITFTVPDIVHDCFSLLLLSYGTSRIPRQKEKERVYVLPANAPDDTFNKLKNINKKYNIKRVRKGINITDGEDIQVIDQSIILPCLNGRVVTIRTTNYEEEHIESLRSRDPESELETSIEKVFNRGNKVNGTGAEVVDQCLNWSDVVVFAVNLDEYSEESNVGQRIQQILESSHLPEIGEGETASDSHHAESKNVYALVISSEAENGDRKSAVDELCDQNSTIEQLVHRPDDPDKWTVRSTDTDSDGQHSDFGEFIGTVVNRNSASTGTDETEEQRKTAGKGEEQSVE